MMPATFCYDSSFSSLVVVFVGGGGGDRGFAAVAPTHAGGDESGQTRKTREVSFSPLSVELNLSCGVRAKRAIGRGAAFL